MKLTIVVLVIGTMLWLTLFHGYVDPDITERAINRFFASKPPSLTVIAYRHDRSIFGDGSYVLTFRMPEPELRQLLKQQGFQVTPIDSNPESWRLSLCNDVLKRLRVTNAWIGPTFDCYFKSTLTNDARVFYDRTNNVAIFVGFGRYTK